MTVDPGDTLAPASSIAVMSADGCYFDCNPVSPSGCVGKRVLKLGSLLPAAVASTHCHRREAEAISLDLLAVYSSVGDLISKPVKFILA